MKNIKWILATLMLALIVRKATIQKSDLRTVTFEGLNARRDTMAKHDEIAEITKENEQRGSSGKPPNWTVILIVLGALMITAIYAQIKSAVLMNCAFALCPKSLRIFAAHLSINYG